MARKKPSILERYPKAICHLYSAKNSGRLALIFGSGISEDLFLPNWKSLLSDLEAQLQYPPGGDAPPSYRAEQLFQYFRRQKISELINADNDAVTAAVGLDWCAFVSRRLYKKYYTGDKVDFDKYKKAIKKHPYLSNLAALASSEPHPLVVTHNFDDAFETALDQDPAASIKDANRRYNTFWKPQPFLRLGVVNIYHPNGYKPLGAATKGSENIILTEANFADHLANTNNMEAHFLLRHLADRTCLIVGHSLSDGTLKNALRLHATQRPGHVNYYIHWHHDGENGLSEDQRTAIRDANFATYNLVTIFANSTEISAIASLINADEQKFSLELENAKLPKKYVYYLSGAVSSGKSTILGHLRDLSTVEEWPERMPAEMNRQSVGLEISAQKLIDEKLETAIWKKNFEIGQIKIGIAVVDRAPLDFIAFPTATEETISKTAIERTDKVLTKFSQAGFENLSQGHVIVISTDPRVLFERQIQRGRTTLKSQTENEEYIEYLHRQQNRMIETYSKPSGNGTVVSSDPCSIVAAVKDVARKIHFDSYEPFPFAMRVSELKAGVSA